MMVTIVYLSVCFFIFLTLDNMLLEKRNSFTFKLVFLPPAQYLCHNSHLINACWRIVSHRKMIKTENWLSSPVYSFWQIGYSSITFMSSLDYKLSKMWTCIWFQHGSRTWAINVRHEWSCSLPSISYCWGSSSSTISHLTPLLQSVTLLACSFNASPCRSAVIVY